MIVGVFHFCEFSVGAGLAAFSGTRKQDRDVLVSYIRLQFLHLGVFVMVSHRVSHLTCVLSLTIGQVFDGSDISLFEILHFRAVSHKKMTWYSVLVEFTVYFIIFILGLFEEIFLGLFGNENGIHRVALVEFSLLLGNRGLCSDLK